MKGKSRLHILVQSQPAVMNLQEKIIWRGTLKEANILPGQVAVSAERNLCGNLLGAWLEYYPGTIKQRRHIMVFE